MASRRPFFLGTDGSLKHYENVDRERCRLLLSTVLPPCYSRDGLVVLRTQEEKLFAPHSFHGGNQLCEVPQFVYDSTSHVSGAFIHMPYSDERAALHIRDQPCSWPVRQICADVMSAKGQSQTPTTRTPLV